MSALSDRLFYLLQCLLPARALTTLADRLARCQTPWLRRRLIRAVSGHFGISLDEARIRDFDAFASFNDFFVRELAPGVRPLAPEPAMLSPVDGRISQLGAIADGEIFQAKGRGFTVEALLGGHQDLAAPFRGGNYATIYLAPNDYHRIHMPTAGAVQEAVYVPGRLFSVNPATVRAAPALFARNERLALLFDSGHGPFALVLVGAMLVSGLETVFTGRVTPPHGGPPFRRPLSGALERGAEVGRFNYGSTVILLTPPGAWTWDAGLAPETALRLGQAIGMPAGG